MGRFKQQDPIHDGLNWYIAFNNNPLRYSDAIGLAVEDHTEFGKNSAIAKKLDALGVDWTNATSAADQKRIHQRIELLRGRARQYFENGNANNGGNQKKVVNGFENIMTYESRINAVSDSFGIEVGVLATVVFRETIMTDWGDAKDFLAAYVGFDTVSVGLCQIQPRTARAAYDNWLTYLNGEPIGSEAEGLTYQQLVKNLNDPSQSIRYAGIIVWGYINTRDITTHAGIFTAYTGNSVTGQNVANYAPYMQSYFLP